MKIKVIIVEDEINILMEIQRNLKRMADVEVVGEFLSPLDALKFIHSNEIDLAILDIEMAGLKGMELAKIIKEIYPAAQILFSTGYSQYAMEAYQLQAMGYLMKPYSYSELESAVLRCRALIKGLRSDNKESQVYVRTFGNFNVYLNGEALFFAHGKAKELFAFLVNARGGTVTMEQIITSLWENRPYDNRAKQLYRKAVSLMRATFRNAGIEEICFFYRSCLASNRKMYSCDYEEFLEGSAEQRRAYIGNYMAEYSWAEDTNAILSNIVNY
ncbi:MAG: response regulator [Clostridium sp.]|nr:response regulator [Clostridium sp.]